MLGRKPQPTALKLICGNPGKRPLNEHEPQPEPAVPECPEHLSAEAKREWERITAHLMRLGLLTEIDRAALAAYCQTYARWIEAEQHIAQLGLVVKAPRTGYPIQNPYLPIANKALEHMRNFLTEFGMTPASRSRIIAGAGGGAGTHAATEDDASDRWKGLIA